MPQDALEAISGWERLPAREKAIIRRETDELTDSLATFGKARMAIGQHLCRVRDILEPQRIFVAYLRTIPYGFSVKTAYRYIQIWEQAKTILPMPVLRVALLRGMDTLNMELVKTNPPPRTQDAKKISAYLDDLRKKQREEKQEEEDPDVKKRECVYYFRSRYSRLPIGWTSRQKAEWLRDVFGMTLSTLGISLSQPVAPVALPDGFVRDRGRPPKKKPKGLIEAKSGR